MHSLKTATFSLASLALATLALAAASAAAQAPIERAYAGGPYPSSAYPAPSAGNPPAPAPAPRITTTQPVAGVWLRVAEGAHVDTVSATADGMELRVTAGVANVTVHHPAQNALLLVDLPGGQVSLVNDGVYTFNAATNTVRTLRGEADALVAKQPVRIKEEHQFTFAPGANHATEASMAALRTDFLPGPTATVGSATYPGGYAYAAGPYGDGPYYGYAAYPVYPYYAYGWGYPYWYGYPFLGVGFGYYRGWGGYYGGYVGRFHR